ncbi:hypothetical protein GTY65_17300 [Streptomyces sp. SID8379]|uniref:hypothetical protein n=1 Tax=unclassified Streptomyces TaxID=2593676 RepID=UPI000370FABF|nr:MULTISPECIES: hypothetical protein [unclassified Streptomyces]MYW65798.1 hypothetical protein [Streptomyces sp. SID8379]
MDANEDFDRTIALLEALDLYERRYAADMAFIAIVAPALALSLPIGALPPMMYGDGDDPSER